MYSHSANHALSEKTHPKIAAVLIMNRTELVELTQSEHVGWDKAGGRSQLSRCRKRTMNLLP